MNRVSQRFSLITLASVCFIASSVSAQSVTVEEAALVDEGFRIFTEETFLGNGRTCSTCHVPEEQYSIGPKFIKGLKGEELDLVLASNVPGLENPTLVEDLALFNTGPGVATDEFPEGPFRSAQQITALDTTTLDFLGVRQMLGWDGTGSPSGGAHHGNIDDNADGSIRAFANGAIAQHMTNTFDRIAKTTACSELTINEPDAACDQPFDFRFATAAELDALAAFQRWLGRRAAEETPNCGDSSAGTERCTADYIAGLDTGSKGEYSLVVFDPEVLQSGPANHEMIFNNDIVSLGRDIYQSDEASCFLCHQNGGAHFGNNGRPHGNLTRDQGLDEFRFDLSDETGINIPADPGDPFGPEGQQRMNVQTVIEAPRRNDFAHNHAISGFEAMVAEGFHKPFVRDLDPELGCAGTGVIGTGAPGREALVGTSNQNHADSEECLEEVWGDNAVNNLAAFMRALSTWYALRDIERLVAESCDRIDHGVSIDLPVFEADILLDTVSDVIRDSRAVPKPHASIGGQATRLKQSLDRAYKSRNKALLKSIHADAQSLRDQIATTTQEGPRTSVCNR